MHVLAYIDQLLIRRRAKERYHLSGYLESYMVSIDFLGFFNIDIVFKYAYL